MDACRLRLISVETFGHNLSDVSQKDATCTEKGLKAHCDTIKSGSSVEIPKIIVATPTPVPTATPTVEPTATKQNFKGLNRKVVLTVPAKQYKSYKKLLRKCGIPVSVKIKKKGAVALSA